MKKRLTYKAGGRWRICLGGVEYTGPDVDRIAHMEDEDLDNQRRFVELLEGMTTAGRILEEDEERNEGINRWAVLRERMEAVVALGGQWRKEAERALAESREAVRQFRTYAQEKGRLTDGDRKERDMVLWELGESRRERDFLCGVELGLIRMASEVNVAAEWAQLSDPSVEELPEINKRMPRRK